MRGMNWSKAGLCGAAMATMLNGMAQAATTPTPVVPKAFRGEWYPKPARCGSDSMEAFVVNDRSTSSGEDDGTVIAVRDLGPNHIVVTTDQMGEATADTPPDTDASAGRLKSDYVLSGGGRRLTIRFGTMAPQTYVRCTGKPAR